MVSIGAGAHSSCRITRSMHKSPNCAIEVVKVAIRMPSAVTENRYSSAPARNSQSEPAIGT
jgi:hypothetical protein